MNRNSEIQITEIAIRASLQISPIVAGPGAQEHIGEDIPLIGIPSQIEWNAGKGEKAEYSGAALHIPISVGITNKLRRLRVKSVCMHVCK